MSRIHEKKLWWRGFVVVGFFIGFYIFALLVAAAIASIPVIELVAFKRIHWFVLAPCGALAWVIVKSLWPAKEIFEKPGVELKESEHPALFDEINKIARAAGQLMPEDVYLNLQFNAAVSLVESRMGFGGRRILIIGMPLMQLLTIEEFRSVVAHEFGHFHGGETKLGPFIYQTRGAIGRTIVALEQRKSWLSFIFKIFGNYYLRVSHGISRVQEYAADQLAANIAGARVAAASLAKLGPGSQLYESYLNTEFLPVLQQGFHVPFVDGLNTFMQTPRAVEASRRIYEFTLKSTADSPYDTHPSTPARILALEPDFKIGAPAEEWRLTPGAECALQLVSDPERRELDILTLMNGKASIQKLVNVSWADVGPRVFGPVIARRASEFREYLGGKKITDLPELIMDRVEFAKKLLKKSVSEEEARGAAREAVIACVLATLQKNGWEFRSEILEAFHVVRGGDQVVPSEWFEDLLANRKTAEDWVRYCKELGIEHLPLCES